MRDAGRHGSHQGYERGEMGDASCMALQGLPLLHVHVGRARASRCAYHLPAGKLRESAAFCENMHENAKARTYQSTLSCSECSKSSQFSAHGCNCQHCCCRLQPPQEVAVHVAGGQLLMEAIRGCIATRPITTKLGASPHRLLLDGSIPDIVWRGDQPYARLSPLALRAGAVTATVEGGYPRQLHMDLR